MGPPLRLATIFAVVLASYAVSCTSKNPDANVPADATADAANRLPEAGAPCSQNTDCGGLLPPGPGQPTGLRCQFDLAGGCAAVGTCAYFYLGAFKCMREPVVCTCDGRTVDLNGMGCPDPGTALFPVQHEGACDTDGGAPDARAD